MRTILAVLISSSVLAACGGGGGSSGGTSAPLLVINSSNQQSVGRATATASTALVGVGDGVGNANSTGGTASAKSVTRSAAGLPGNSIAGMAMYLGHTLAAANDAQRTALSASRAGGTSRSLAVAPTTVNCGVSGTMTLSLVDADNSGTATSGDSMTLSFNQCKDSATDSVNGSMTIALGGVSVNGGLVSFNGSLSMNALTVVEGGRTAAMNGGLTLNFTEVSTTQTQATLTVGSSGLSASVSGSQTDAVSFDAGFALNVTEVLSSTPGGVDTSTATFSGSFSTTAIGGRVQLETPTALLQWSSDTYPRAGVLRVTGSSSALRLTVLDATTVRLELDGNLDGTYESTTDVPWSTLLPG
ncbi:hypothetical protein [Piscinibacter terrae]|uniref:Lipoprotein n=1 Tax=Piscinibacter terrae TaxID=2496871 RepID=A0A3N7HSR5_9BURK|nr:hypothetical protein [Albitalea terrae]RQP24803.1 hypothetical protein DZC73_07935 [Albitalea terrae]